MKDWIVSFYYEDSYNKIMYDEFIIARDHVGAMQKAKKLFGQKAIIVEIMQYE